MHVYDVFETYGYQIALKCDGSKDSALRMKSFSADKPNPPILDVFYGDGNKGGVMFRFANTNRQAATRRSGAQ